MFMLRIGRGGGNSQLTVEPDARSGSDIGRASGGWGIMRVPGRSVPGGWAGLLLREWGAARSGTRSTVTKDAR